MNEHLKFCIEFIALQNIRTFKHILFRFRIFKSMKGPQFHTHLVVLIGIILISIL